MANELQVSLVNSTVTFSVSGNLDLNPTSGEVSTVMQGLGGTSPWAVSGTVYQGNPPWPVTLPTPIGISGGVSILNTPTVMVQGPVEVSGTFNAIVLSPLGVSGFVSVGAGDGAIASIGSTGDVEASIDGGTLIALLKRLRTLNSENDLGVSVSGAAGAAVTLTLPAVSGQYHYIGYASVQAYASANTGGQAAPIFITTTNLPGSPVMLFDTLGTKGAAIRQVIQPAQPIRSSVAGVATTISCPATSNIIWWINVFYRTDP